MVGYGRDSDSPGCNRPIKTKIPDPPTKREGKIKQMTRLLQCRMNYESIQDTHGYPPEVDEIENTKNFRNLVITQKSPILCAKCLPNTWKVRVAACAAAIVPSMKVGYLALIVGDACGKEFRFRCFAYVHFVSRAFCFAVVVGADLAPLSRWFHGSFLVYPFCRFGLMRSREGAKSDANGVQFGRIA